LKFYLFTKNILKKENFDIIHSHYFSSPVRRPLLLEIHQFEWTTAEPWLLRSPLFRLRRSYVIKRADAILTHTYYIKNQILRETNITAENVYVIPYAANHEMATASKSLRKKWRDELGVNGKLVFYYPARITPSKAQDLLLKSLKTVEKDVLNNSFFILSGSVQDNKYYKTLLDLAHDLPVYLLPEFDVEPLYAASDVVLSSTLHIETFGKILLEGMTMEKPLLIPDIDVFKEVSKGNALFFKKGDMIDLANRIELMYYNDNLRAELTKKGIKIVKDFYKPETYKKKLLALYEVLQ
jgi:glycosyltransferase involved in cell wall biosynthesis